MRQPFVPLLVVTAIFSCILIASPAFAQPTIAGTQYTRTFVSGAGSDSGGCSFASPCCTFAAPCRSFQHAHNHTVPRGEIDVLGPADYGALTITKSISIQGHGWAAISPGTGASGITINSGVNDTVNLRGLIIEGFGIGLNGILFNSGTSLSIEQCVIQNLTNNGIQFTPTQGTPPVDLTVIDTFLANNGDSGVIIQPTGTIRITAVFKRVEAVKNHGHGMAFVSFSGGTGINNITVADSVITGSPLGLFANAELDAIIIMLFHSVVANNDTGLQAVGRSSILVGDSAVTGNANGWTTVTAGNMETYGDNKVDGNLHHQGVPLGTPGGLISIAPK